MFQDEWTPLMIASHKGHLPIVEYLVEQGGDLEAQDEVCHLVT